VPRNKQTAFCSMFIQAQLWLIDKRSLTNILCTLIVDLESGLGSRSARSCMIWSELFYFFFRSRSGIRSS